VHAEAMSRACVSADEQSQGFVLACRTRPMSDVTVTAVDRLAGCFERSSQQHAPASFLARATLPRSSHNTTEGD
jgi:hypothetical protein